MDSKLLFKKALQQATATIRCIEKRHFKNSTPCTDWDCHTLINHMLYELCWVPDMLAGKTVSEVGGKYDGDLIGDKLQANWQKASRRALDALKKVNLTDTVHLSYADVPASDYLREISNDLVIHSWDACQSINCSLKFEPDVAAALYDQAYRRRDEFAGSGLFGLPFDVPQDSRLQTKLLAIEGRHEPKP